ncbi:phage baseplate protein [Bosea sp. RCC_152_1]|uniref:phage baseplate protein n=1 Tax=Bosea sp. RCC_152_1 TaxID=3239228 RepID=UPI0035260215
MALLDDTFALIRRPGVTIDTMVPDVMVREAGRDTLITTDHPVESGAAISDHAFKMPAEIEMIVGWSDSTGGYTGYSDEAYQMLLAIQARRQPIEVSTGRRNYQNMLPVGIQETRDESTANVLMCSLRLREIIIVNTQTTTAPKSAQANPAKTGSTTDVGQQSLKTGPGGRVVGGV